MDSTTLTLIILLSVYVALMTSFIGVITILLCTFKQSEEVSKGKSGDAEKQVYSIQDRMTTSETTNKEQLVPNIFMLINEY